MTLLPATHEEKHQLDTKPRSLRNQPVRTGTSSSYKQALLYGAFALILVELAVGLFTSLWIGQVKDVGVSIDWSGRLLSVQPGSFAEESGARVGDYVTFEDFMHIREFSGNSNTGDRL